MPPEVGGAENGDRPKGTGGVILPQVESSKPDSGGKDTGPAGTFIYTWGNNPKRASLKGRRCRVLARGALNSCLVEFENGQREIISRNALRKEKGETNEDHV